MTLNDPRQKLDAQGVWQRLYESLLASLLSFYDQTIANIDASTPVAFGTLESIVAFNDGLLQEIIKAGDGTIKAAVIEEGRAAHNDPAKDIQADVVAIRNLIRDVNQHIVDTVPTAASGRLDVQTWTIDPTSKLVTMTDRTFATSVQGIIDLRAKMALVLAEIVTV